MKKIAIISSFSESCGNAYFTKVLLASMRKFDIDAQCLELDLKLTQSIESFLRKKANLHIDQLCTRLQDFDGINIQLEPSLYGLLPFDVKRRVLKLAKVHPKTSVTLHSPRLITDTISQRSVLKHILCLRLKRAARAFLSDKKTKIHNKLNRSIIAQLAARNVPLIVHTKRAKKEIKQLFGYENVAVHPLKIVSPEFSPEPGILSNIKEMIGLRPTDKVIGIFGYISKYKGHTLAIEALSLLSPEYHLLIFGRQHPQTIQDNEPVDPYLRRLQAGVRKKNLQNRVFFMGEYDTDSFASIVASVDIVWLPYVENGQDGSGIASICLDMAQRVMCSASFAFDELFQLIPYKNVYRFDIGNALELALKTQMILQDHRIHREDTSDFSTLTQAKMYIESVS